MSQATHNLADPPIASSGTAQSESPGSASLAGVFVFRHFAQLDGLRGLAIVLVVGGHVIHHNFGIPAGGNIGSLGVLLFFTLSGFLITGMLDREKVQSGSVALPKFYLRRVLRLFPAFFVFIAVVSLLIKLRVITDTPWYAVAACLLYVRNIWGRGYATNHIWSLSVEEQFYASWPWIMSVVSRMAAMRIAIGGTVAVSLFRMLAIHWGWFNYWAGIAQSRPWYRFDSILIGCVIALRLCGSVDVARFKRYLPTLGMPALLWPGILAWTWWGERVTQTWFLTVQLLFSAAILLHLLISEDSVYLRIFSHPIASWLGSISYSWYLWQQLFVVTDPPARILQSFPFDVGVSLLLAIVSYRYIERPFLRLKNRVHNDTDSKMNVLPWVAKAARTLWKPLPYAR